MKNQFSPQLLNYCNHLESEFNRIDEERKQVLFEFSAYILRKKAINEVLKLEFICTHNSRRSHFGQIWAQTAALYFGISGIETFSGGTEASEFNKRSVAALLRAGFIVENSGLSKELNPRYFIKQGDGIQNNAMFSKVYNHQLNPKEDFCAIMVCSHADENCPFIQGAEKRFSIPYNDPKEFDGTDEEIEKYDESCKQIAREMFFTFDRVRIEFKNL
jgi:protein-tyrosine phosphatase/arsenate reductase